MFKSCPQYEYGDKLKIAGVLKSRKILEQIIFDWPGLFGQRWDSLRDVLSASRTYFRRQRFWLKEKLFALKRRFLSAIAKSSAEPHSAFGRDNNPGARGKFAAEDLRGKFRTTGVAHIGGLVRIQHNHRGGSDNAVFQFPASISGHRRGDYRGNFVCLMTGASTTVLRASIMALLALTGQNHRREFIPFLGRYFGGFFMILQNPEDFKI